MCNPRWKFAGEKLPASLGVLHVLGNVKLGSTWTFDILVHGVQTFLAMLTFIDYP